MLPSIDSLNCFLEAARHLNFRAAAKVVSLTPAAFGQRIKQLEEQLGCKLFHRTTREVVLTREGLALVPYAQQVLQSVQMCLRAGDGSAGPVPMELVIGTRHELGMSWLLPMLDDLEASHPGLTLQLYFGSGPDLMVRVRSLEIDCAISSSVITDAKLDFARLHKEDYAFVGTPELLDERPLNTPSDAKRHTLIDAHPRLPLFMYYRGAPGAYPDLSFREVRRLGTISAIREWVLASRGVAVLPLYLVAPDLEAGRLRRVFAETSLTFDHFRLIFRADDPRKSVYGSLAQQMLRHPLR
ncbi:MAG: LysR family transcriptional regulator [Myxococcales bacterium]|nr:LysR family transcriptional regulator [Myxococcales bacterium]